MELLKKYYNKYKEMILYLLFGGLTTLVNFLSYLLLAYIFSFSTVVSTAGAWILSVLFAYITNKIWVFESKCNSKKALLQEITAFFSCRAFSGILDIAVMWIFVDYLHFNDLWMKLLSNLLVIVLNYVFSKLLIFKKQEKGEQIR